MNRLSKRLVVIVGALAVVAAGAYVLFRQFTRDTEHHVYYFHPDWSPDGSQIVFESTRDGMFAIYTIRVDGSDLRKLTSGANDDDQPRWSPDGKQIVYVSDQHGPMQLYIMNADGSQQRRLTDADADDYRPDFSPTGDRIVFMSGPPGPGQSHDLYVVNADGTGRTRLTDQDADYMWPRWSPGGEEILYARGSNSWFSSSSAQEVFVMRTDGAQARNLTNNDVRDDHPRWSSDGRTIYFVSEREGAAHVYAMGADGSGAQKVADGSIVVDPDVSPDGNYFVYTKEVDGKAGLYIYDIRSAKERLLVGG